MIEMFNDVEVRNTGLIYSSTFEQIKKIMKQFTDMGRGTGKRGRGFGKKMKIPF